MRHLLLILLLPLAACGSADALPRDQKGAMERIRATHVLRAGASLNPPWVETGSGEPQGVEPDLIRAFAASLGARVEWNVNGEAPLVEGLEKQALDLVAAGATTKSPWKKKVGVSQSYARSPKGEHQVLLAAAGENQLLLALDRFIVAHKPALEARAAEEARQ
jgi:polar amino acid transport system substrate-binding protein